MAQQVVTELVIDSDTSGADRFSQSMDKAGASAERGSSSVQSMSMAIAGVSVASIAALAALRGFVDFVGNQTQSLVDMSNQAQLAGISLREFQQTLFAARASGLTEKDFVSGLDRIGADLTAASRGVTEFGKLFEANGLSIRQANGELKTTKQAIADLAGLVQNASPQIQQSIARIAGISAAWVPFLKQGVEGIEAQKKAAADLGVIIDDDIINKAKEFNAQWKTAVAGWDLQFKASIASILPLLIQLANLASKVIEGVGAVSGFLSRSLTPQDQWSTGDLEKQMTALQQYRRELLSVNAEISEFQNFKLRNKGGALGLDGSDVATVDAAIAKIKALIEEKKKLVRIEVNGGTTILPPANDDNDAVDRALLSLQKHIEMQKADAAAMGLGARAHAELRAEAALTAAVQANGGKITQEQADEFQRLKLEAGGAADALYRVSIRTQAIGQATAAVGNFADTLIQGMLKGADATQTLVGAMASLGSTLQSIGSKNIMDGLKSALSGGAFTLDPISLGLGAAGIGISLIGSLLGNDSENKKQHEEALKRWADMADQVSAFNDAAAGFDLGPLTNEMKSLITTFETLRRAADEAGDSAGAARLNASFMQGVTRLVDEFKAGAETLSPLQTAIRAVNDEYRGLTETLNALNYGSLTIGLDEAAAAQIRKIIGQYTDELNASLAERLNNANGQSYLNDAAALLKRRQADLALAAELGNDPSVLAQISLVFHAEAQKIVDDAGLVGSAFTDFTTQFPDLAGVVVQANEDMTASAKRLADQMNASARSITDYVNGLFAGSASTLSPTAQLAAAQSTYNAKLALAQGGNLDAQGSITQDAENLRQAARAVFASGSGYQKIFSQITSQLLALPAVQSTTDPVTAAVRDVVTATQAGNATLALVNANTSATVAAAQSIAALQTASNTLITTTNNLTTSQNGILTAIQGLNQTSATQLTLLQAALAPGSISLTLANVSQAAKDAFSAGSSTFILQNTMVQALNKIVYNTGLIVRNTWAVTTASTGRPFAVDTAAYASGGWITGGTPGVDSVPLASGALGMPGEFVVRNAVAQANAAWLPAFNRTGQIPSNDNGGVIAAINMLRSSNEMMQRQIAQLIWDAGEKGAQATKTSGAELRAEMRMRKRDQRERVA